jgi:hypothetical protein
MYEDRGFESKYDGPCVICMANCEPGSKIAAAPRVCHRRNRRGSLLRFGHLRCVLNARENPAAVYFGGAV